MSTQFVQAAWGGILFGSVYGLMALGLTLVWGAVRLLNLAHGALFVVGSYVAYWVVSSLNLPILIALPIGVLAAAAFAYVMHLIFIRPVIGKPGFDNATLIATVGISIAVSAAAILIFNPEYKVVPPVISGNFTVSQVQITKQGLLVIGASLALFGTVYLFLTYSRLGMAIRAVSQFLLPESQLGLQPDDPGPDRHHLRGPWQRARRAGGWFCSRHLRIFRRGLLRRRLGAAGRLPADHPDADLAAERPLRNR